MGKPQSPKLQQVQSPEMAFGIVLRNARKRCGLNQDALAFKAGYHRNYISQLERGEKSPSLRTIVNVASVVEERPSGMLRKMERLLNASRS